METCESCGAYCLPSWAACAFCQVTLSSQTAEAAQDHDLESPPAVLAATDQLVRPEARRLKPKSVEPADSRILTAGSDRFSEVDQVDLRGGSERLSRRDQKRARRAPRRRRWLSRLLLLLGAAAILLAVLFFLSRPAGERLDLGGPLFGGSESASGALTSLPVVSQIGADPVGSELVELGRQLCAGELDSLPDAGVLGNGRFTQTLYVPLSQGAEAASGELQAAQTAAPIGLVACVEVENRDEVVAECKFRDGFSQTWLGTDYRARLLRAENGDLLRDETIQFDNYVCPGWIVTYDDTPKAAIANLPATDRLRDLVEPFAPGINPAQACAAASSLTAAEDPFSIVSVEAFSLVDASQPMALPAAWLPSAGRPANAALCIAHSAQRQGNDGCETLVSVVAATDTSVLGSWTETIDGCDWGEALPTPSQSWLEAVVGPALGLSI